MKTENILSKYYTYSIIWANKIIANIEGYSIDKAYEISPVFAKMVQAQLDDYQKQLDRLKYTATTFGVFDECKSMFDKFYETCKKDIQQLIINPKTLEILNLRTYEEVLIYAKLWDDKFAYVMQQIGNISLEKTKWLPSTYANIFKEQHEIINRLLENIRNWNQESIDIYTRQAKIYTEMKKSDYTESDIIEEWYLSEKDGSGFYEREYERWTYVQAYKSNMELLENIRKDLLDD